MDTLVYLPIYMSYFFKEKRIGTMIVDVDTDGL